MQIINPTHIGLSGKEKVVVLALHNLRKEVQVMFLEVHQHLSLLFLGFKIPQTSLVVARWLSEATGLHYSYRERKNSFCEDLAEVP